MSGNFWCTGVYWSSTPTAYITTAGVKELYDIEGSEITLKLGGCVSLGRAIETFKTAKFAEGFHYLESLANHWSVVANTATRNVCCVALLCALCLCIYLMGNLAFLFTCKKKVIMSVLMIIVMDDLRNVAHHSPGGKHCWESNAEAWTPGVPIRHFPNTAGCWCNSDLGHRC